MQPDEVDIDDLGLRRRADIGGIVLTGDIEDLTIRTKKCDGCGKRWKPLPQNFVKAHVCSNACRMKMKKKHARGEWDRPKQKLPWKPWTHVKKRTD